MKNLLYVAMPLIIIAVNLSAQTTDEPDDMKECIAQIKAWGMSEGAKTSIETIAGMRIGGSNWEFRKDESSGMYWTSFTSNRCDLPSEDPVQAEQEKMKYRYKLDKEISRIKILADFDSSGFINTEEAFKFRRLIEFGYKASFVAREEDGHKEWVCLGLQAELGSNDLKVLDEKINEYAALREKAEKNGIDDLPEIVLE